MKKLIFFLLIILTLIMTLLVGCKKDISVNQGGTSTDAMATSAPINPTATSVPDESSLKSTGLPAETNQEETTDPNDSSKKVTATPAMTNPDEQIVPFEPNPESQYKDIDLDKEIARADEMRDLYNNMILSYITKKRSDDVFRAMVFMTEEEKNNFVKRSHIIYQLTCDFSSKEDELRDYLLKGVKNYLLASRMGETGLEYYLNDSLKAADPIAMVQKYMKDNDIVVTDLTLPDTFVDYDLYNYPMSLKYTYDVKGTVGGKPFEKEVTQVFYEIMTVIGDHTYQEYIAEIQ